jgi:signal peptidase I
MGTWFRILAWLTGITTIVCGALYLLVFDVWRVPGDDPLLTASILPTLAPGDLLVVSRHPGIGRGQLLRCADPQAPGRFVVARAMGEGGDHLAIDSEIVNIDGHHTPSPRACDEPRVTVFNPNTNEDEELNCSIEDYGETTHPTLRAATRLEPPTRLTVERGKWFLVSNDRHLHLDSRDYGQVEGASCQHIVFRLVGAGGVFDSSRRMSMIW